MPRCSTVEYARSRLRSFWNSAYVMPPSAERPPRTSTVAPIQDGVVPIQSTRTRTRPYAATATITPLISAEIGAGAMGWARGSQTCIGINPAFVPKPMIAAIAITACTARSLGERGRVADRFLVGKKEDRDPRPRTAQVGDRHVREHGLPGCLRCRADQDDRRRDERHQLPEEEERERIARAENADEGEQERCGEDAGDPAGRRPGDVRRGKDKGRACDEREGEQERSGEAVDPEPWSQLARERRTPRITRCEGPQPRCSESERTERLGEEPCRGAAVAQTQETSGHDREQPADHEDGHSAASSSSNSCCSASDRAISSRPVSSKSKTRGSAAR